MSQGDLFSGSPDTTLPVCYNLACRRRGHPNRDCALNVFTRAGLATCALCGAPVDPGMGNGCGCGLAALQRANPGQDVADVLADIMDEDDALVILSGLPVAGDGYTAGIRRP